MQSHILAVDLGTNGCKALVFNTKGEIRGSGIHAYHTDHPRPGWVEQDPKEWWTATVRAIEDSLKSSKIALNSIEVIGLTGQMSGIVALGERGETLRPCIIWMDRRATDQAEELRRKFGEEYLYRITGHRIDPAFFAVKALWIKENEPTIFDKAQAYLVPKDFIRFKLTESLATDYGDASGSMLLDLIKKDWSSKLLDELEIPREKLPTLKSSDEIAGTISPEASRLTGLPAGVPVIAGSGDAICATLGAGVVEEGVCHDVTGTSTIASVVSDEPIIDPKMRVITNCYGVKGKWLIEAPNSTSGALLNWYKDNFADEELEISKKTGRDIFDLLSEEASSIDPGANGLVILPYFQGERSPVWDPAARGIIAGLTLGHTKRHIARAIFESASYLLAHLIETMEDLGVKVEEIRATGGGSKSKFWLQTKADVTGRTIRSLKVSETSLMGSMVLAACAAGYYRDTKEAIENIIQFKETFEPDQRQKAVHSANFSVYKDLYERTKGLRFG
jgi:xylulokinase